MARYEDHLDDDNFQHASDVMRAGSPICSPNSYKGSMHMNPSLVATPSVAPVATGAASHNSAAKRKVASEFIQGTTGVFIHFSSDQAFRGALKDGVLLCKLANTVWNGAGIQYLEPSDVDSGPQGLLQQRNYNIQAFLSAMEQQLPSLPADCRFNIADLEAEGSGERPQVANCILYIRSACMPLQSCPSLDQMPMTPPTAPRSGSSTGSRQHYSTPPHQPAFGMAQMSYMTPNAVSMGPQHSIAGGYGYGGSPGMIQHRASPAQYHSPVAALPSPLMDGQNNLSHGGQYMQHTQQNHSGAGHAAGHHVAGSLVPLRSSQYGSSLSSAQHKSVQAAAGVTKLMQQCTNMLKDRMFPAEPGSASSRYNGSPGPDSAIKALGPVLENVLGHLTEEYEKRLLAKDHDLSRMSDAKHKAEREFNRLQEEVNQLKQEAEAAGAEVAKAAAEESAAEVQVLRRRLQEAEAALEEKEQELTAARNMLNSADTTRAHELLRAQMECHRLKEELDEFQDLHDRYKRVVEENRNLYNTVQDLRGNVRVFCRIRPPGATGDLSPCCVDIGLEGELAIYDQQNGTKRVFKVDRVFDQNADQAAVYEDTQPLIRSVLDGYNVCIFAYGQTGSGKTHTMSGTDTMHETGRGINYRALNDLFAIRDARNDEVAYSFSFQMLEIYNENLRDLLVDGRSCPNNRLEILATQASGCNVPGATQIEVSNAADVANLMAKGASQRATSETKMNDRSSRSHQILTVIVDGLNHVTRARTHGCLHLIDLAGSERVGKSEASGDRLVEAQHINRSLSALGDVMAALAGKAQHVPYRNSKLTQLLQDSLQGQAKVMMFMHVSPEGNMYGESVSTLKFASRVSEITLGQAKKNVVSGKVFEAHEEVIKQQRTMEGKEQQLQQLQAALKHERELREQQQHMWQQEVEHLRQQLKEATGTGAAPVSAGKQRSHMLQLPIQQMLAQQAAEAEAAAAVSGVLSSSRSRSRALTGGGAEEAGYTGSPASVSRTTGRSRIDMTPTRDQDDCSLMQSAWSQVAAEASYDYSNIEATPRPTPRRASTNNSGLPLPPREQSSAQKHLERLQSARHHGTYKPSTANTTSTAHGASSSAAAGSGLSGGSRQSSAGLGDAAGTANLKEQASKLTGSTTARGGYGPGLSSRSSGRSDTSVPLTARVSAVIKSRVSELPSSATMSMRQGGVYSRSSSITTAAATSAAISQRASAVTSRSGSRWK